MKIKVETRLTSAEIGDLWTSYMNDSMVTCTLKYFLATVEDPEIRPLLEYALGISQKHVQFIAKIFKQENYPVPQGFTDSDVNLSAPPLYSDIFFPFYLEHMAKYGMLGYGISLPLIARSDVRKFISEALTTSIEISNRVVQVLLSKGLYVRPPYVSIPQNVDFVKNQNFLGNLIGKNRPLQVTEILNLYANIRTNVIGHTLSMGFGQVAQSKEISKYMFRGKDIASKHIEIFSEILRKEDIPASTNWDTGVTNSTNSPFSDKLMMFHITLLTAAGIASYGAAVSLSMRRDISATYMRLIAEILDYAEDGVNIMIDNGWLEQPPQAVNHEALAMV
jgi:hypothetical protein